MSFFSKIVENKSTALAVAIGAGAVIGLAWYYLYYLASIKTIRMIATIQERMMLLMILILRRKSKNSKKLSIPLTLVLKTLNLS